MKRLLSLLVMVSCLVRPAIGEEANLFDRTNLVAWCIVPFDARKRGPEERAQMLQRLGVQRLAYDWRAEHIPTFDAEIAACKKHNIELTAWWFPGTLDQDAKTILDTLQRNKVSPQLWITGGGEPTKTPEEQSQRVQAEANRIRPLAEAAAKIGSNIALYNHGGWFGEPENQIAIIRALGMTNVGIVYNFHHGHEHIKRFPEMFRAMQPFLLAVNINGMKLDADKQGQKIMALGSGDQERAMIQIIQESGWKGPIGILDHRMETDSEETLVENLKGLDQLLERLKAPAKDEPKKQAANKKDYWAVEDAEARARLPLYKTIPAATSKELTPANGFPRKKSLREWTRSHGNAYGMRYSGLEQINRKNVAQLEVAWTYHSGDGADNVQCNPIIVNGILIAPTSGKNIVGINAETGVEVWRFKPELPRNIRLQDIPARRGMVMWPGNKKHGERVFFSCGDWIYAVDPKNGKPVAEFGTDGRTAIPMSGTAAGAVFKEILVVPGFHGDVFGYHAGTGELLWRFHTIPKAGEFGHDTWDGPTEGANCWGGMALDEERGIAFITTGSPKPNFAGNTHHGENLYANCVVAIDARTGKRLWHFQEIRHDIWDLDLPAPPNLLTIEREGKRVDVVAAVSKMGNTLLLDRVTGKPIYPVRLRRAPTSKLPGEKTVSYQPAIELPEPFSRQIFTLEDVTTRTEEAGDYVRQRIASANFGFFEPFEEGKPTVFYGVHGGAEWTGAAVDPTEGLLYVSANEMPSIVSVFRNDEPPRKAGSPATRGEEIYQQTCATCHGANRIGVGTAPPLIGLRHRLSEDNVRALLKTGRNLMPAAPEMPESDTKALIDFLFLRDRLVAVGDEKKPERPRYSHNGYPKLRDHEGYPGCKPPWGTLNCIDLNTGKIRWKVPLGEYAELTAEGLPKTGTENFGGPSVSAGGLVFCAGTKDEMIRAFDADTGEELWKHKLPYGGFTSPSIYEVNGRQFVVIPATGGGKLGTPAGDAYVAFALPVKR